MPTRDIPVIIAAFTYGLLEEEFLCKLVGRDWNNTEELLKKFNRFLGKKMSAQKNTLGKSMHPPEHRKNPGPGSNARSRQPQWDNKVLLYGAAR